MGTKDVGDEETVLGDVQAVRGADQGALGEQGIEGGGIAVRAQPALRQAVGRAQAQHQRFRAYVFVRERLAAARPVGQALAVPAARLPAVEGMRPRAQAHVGEPPPVGAVVDGLETRAGKVGDFVVVITGGPQTLAEA